jgi:hypothetical protein
MKKRITFAFCLFLFFGFSQDNTSTDPYQPHSGFQFSIFSGGMAGSIQSNISDVGDVEMKGSRVSARFQVGYASKYWAGGFSFGSTSMAIKSMVIDGTTYSSTSNSSITSNLIGAYIKRYFMPINVFTCVDLGISKFGITDQSGTLIAATDNGFAWNIAVGKEFLVGKRKRIGLGAYVNLAGAKCHDIPPYQNDVYSFISPGMGVVLSYR